MFNYWTEGGFIAWGQVPDANTGKTPLQLFMDGRAQAAYGPEVYQMWANIMAGGPVAAEAAARGKALTVNDYIKMGRWTADELKSHDVWVVLMPAEQFDSALVRGLEYNPNWPMVYMDVNQELFVDATTPQGKALFEGIFNGKTVYPDRFSENLVKAHNMFLFSEGKAAKKEALDYAIKAFNEYPSRAPLLKILPATVVPELRQTVGEFCVNYADDFVKNKGLYAKQGGYFHRLLSAYIVCDYLQDVAKRQKKDKLVEFYAANKREYWNEQKMLAKNKRW